MTANLMGTDGIIVLVIALIVLVGGSQLPKLARNVGMAGREFRNAQREAEEDAEREKSAKAVRETVAPPAAPNPPVALSPAASPAPVAAAPPAPVAAAPVAAAPAEPAGTAADGSITLTPAQLDALLKAREQQVRGETSNS